jgi:A/G-specific adenine glycosylase
VRDPYKLLVAEVLLQRSRSGTVAKVYAALALRFPTARDLASAETAQVEALISPLGLSRRAITLQRIAEELESNPSVRWTEERLRALPGVGPATAASVACSMGLRALPIDAVSGRVYRRLLGVADPLRRPGITRAAKQRKIALDELNWAALDLAAALCLPKQPRCKSCPLAPVCRHADPPPPAPRVNRRRALA